MIILVRFPGLHLFLRIKTFCPEFNDLHTHPQKKTKTNEANKIVQRFQVSVPFAMSCRTRADREETLHQSLSGHDKQRLGSCTMDECQGRINVMLIDRSLRKEQRNPTKMKNIVKQFGYN